MKESKRERPSKGARKRFNVVDVLLILFILLIVVVCINLLSPISYLKKLTADNTHLVEYTVEISGVDKAYLESVKANDVVMDSVSKQNVGTVTAVDCNTPYAQLVYDEVNDVGVLAEHVNESHERYNMLITITVECTYEEGQGYLVHDRRIAVGEQMSLRFPNFLGEGYCIGFAVQD